MLDSTLLYHHEYTNWGNNFWENGVHASRYLQKLCQSALKLFQYLTKTLYLGFSFLYRWLWKNCSGIIVLLTAQIVFVLFTTPHVSYAHKMMDLLLSKQHFTQKKKPQFPSWLETGLISHQIPNMSKKSNAYILYIHMSKVHWPQKGWRSDF